MSSCNFPDDVQVIKDSEDIRQQPVGVLQPESIQNINSLNSVDGDIFRLIDSPLNISWQVSIMSD